MTKPPELRIDRRRFLVGAASVTATLALTSGWSRAALATPAEPGPLPYGPLATTPDPNGLLLPQGFRSRVIAFSDEPVAGTDYVWHRFPDGGATFRQPHGGWVYVSNSEVSSKQGGVGAVRFDARREDHRRVPHPRRHRPQLRGRPDAVGHVAVVRGARRRTRLGVRSQPGEPGRRTARARHVLARSRRGRPARQGRVPHRGRPRRPPLPLRADCVSRPERGHVAGRARR